MCIRNAYHCKECNTTFAIPAQNITDSLWWKDLMCLLMYAAARALFLDFMWRLYARDYWGYNC